MLPSNDRLVAQRLLAVTEEELQCIVLDIHDGPVQNLFAIVTGDTKVVNRGKADQLFINTAGVGLIRREATLSAFNARPGDKVIINGPLGDHGIAVMIARESLDMELDVVSDTAALHTLAAALLNTVPDVRCLKDPTRGGLATSLNEIALSSEVAIAIDELAVPVRAAVRGACEILGLDPMTITNEGKLIAIVPPESAETALAVLRRHPLGVEASMIGEVRAEPPGMVFLRTEIGGTRVLDMLVGDPLPRIC